MYLSQQKTSFRSLKHLGLIFFYGMSRGMQLDYFHIWQIAGPAPPFIHYSYHVTAVSATKKVE